MGVIVSRLPRGQSIRGRSRCEDCGRQLASLDLIPVLSWVVLRGHCRYCGVAISPRSTLLELGCAALAALASVSIEETGVALLVASVGALLIAITAIDLECRRIPNQIVYPAAACALTFVVIASRLGSPLSVSRGLIGATAFAGFLLALAILSRGGMGMGDVKLSGLIGFVVGSIHLASVLVAAGLAVLLGGLAAIIALLRGADRKTALPFGPMLAAGAIIASFWGPTLADAYLRFLR